MTSTALLLRSLRTFGADVDYAIPSRMHEGYGINKRIIEEFHSEGISLILTVDNGISAFEPIARAKELGLNANMLRRKEPSMARGRIVYTDTNQP